MGRQVSTLDKKSIAEATTRLGRAYSAVADVFEAVARQSGAAFRPEQAPAFRVRAIDGRLHATCLTKIERLPYRRHQSASPPQRDRITVVLDSSETFRVEGDRRAPKLCLMNSTVKVAYYRPQQDRLTTLLCVRYDFDGAADAHPIFHAQIDTNAVDQNKLVRLGLSSPVTPMPEHHERVRIPTANVIGPTALLQIGADHLPYEKFARILHKIRGDVLFTRWTCDRSTLDRPKALAKLLSSTWYAPN